MAVISPRLRKPAGIALAGVMFAAAWLVRGGPLWWVSIVTLILTAVRAGSWYWMVGKDGVTVAIAVKGTWWWPFGVALAVTGFGFLLGLSTYGSGEPDEDDDVYAGQPRRPQARN